jgi:putative ATPase
MPEGLYPLAEAALYLAGTEKSNSALGFFDAVKTVRQASRQQVPAHLRDAHRDGRAFGDGVGYRYPHAYAEHWVAQQYLPGSLQGEVFWQPGSLGWEGRLRQRLQERRAAQLAAVAESAADQPELLSHGPGDPQLNRWLQRQAAAEGERLDQLRRRFWEGAAIGRLDRVLVLDARSLLWALDSLQGAAEGEVVVTVSDPGDLERLQDQVQVLDQLRRPRLLAIDPQRPETLDARLEPDWRCEWIVARQPFRGLAGTVREEWLRVLGGRAASGCRLRLLLSHPQLTPAASLQRHLSGKRSAALPLLERIVPIEKDLLHGGEDAGGGVWERGLEARGWEVRTETWQESLQLPLDEGLLERWLAPEAPYRRGLAGRVTAEELETLAELFRSQRGSALPQPIIHTLLLARKKAPAEPGR